MAIKTKLRWFVSILILISQSYNALTMSLEYLTLSHITPASSHTTPPQLIHHEFKTSLTILFVKNFKEKLIEFFHPVFHERVRERMPGQNFYPGMSTTAVVVVVVDI